MTQEQQSEERRKPKNIIGGRVRQARLERRPRVTQVELASLLEAYEVFITQAGISKIEAGNRPVLDFELKALGEALVVPVGWLLDEQVL